MAKFKAGDPVWAISRAEYYLLPIGKYAGIVEVACSLQCYECYEVDVIGHPSSFDNSGLWHVAACDLEPRHDNDGSLKVIEWLADDLAAKERVD